MNVQNTTAPLTATDLMSLNIAERIKDVLGDRQMISNESIVLPTFKLLKSMKDTENFVIDKSGVKTVEVINADFSLDPRQKVLKFNGRRTPLKYAERELRWYDSEDLSIEQVEDVAIWKAVAGDDGTINSNYGYLVYNEENGSQFKNVVEALKNNKATRQAVMIYNRPTMHTDYNAGGKSDFVCTMFHHFFIRNNELISIPCMRSNDAIFGFMNDWYWFATVHMRVFEALKELYPNLKEGIVHYRANSFHVYERHFEMLDKICETSIDLDSEVLIDLLKFGWELGIEVGTVNEEDVPMFSNLAPVIAEIIKLAIKGDDYASIMKAMTVPGFISTSQKLINNADSLKSFANM
jgi:thymidylate synthase